MFERIEKISYKHAMEFVLPKHYSGRKPNVVKAYGLFLDDVLKGVCIFGKPASPSLCRGVMGIEYRFCVYELNRLCIVEDVDYPLSKFVAYCLRDISDKNNWIIMAYADTAMNHIGYIYQACNFMYTGKTKRRTDKYTEGNKHSRHYKNDEQKGLRKVRSSKHRYIYFCTTDKKVKKEWMRLLNYPILPYPKGKNKRYRLGEFLKPEIIKI